MDLESARLLMEQWGYLIIIGLTFLEGETVVIAAGLLASQQVLNLNPWLIALSAFTGTFCCDQITFALGKYKGESVLRRFPRLAKNSEKARRLIKEYETPIIVGFRFVYGIRVVTPILLGASGVRHLKFVILNFIGAGVWASTFALGSFYLGEIISAYLTRNPDAKYFFIGGLVLLAATVVTVVIVRKRRKQNCPDLP